MVLSRMPGNPLTSGGLQYRLNNAASRGISSASALSKYFHGLPGNPLTAGGLQQRINNTSPSGRGLSTLGGIIGSKAASSAAAGAASNPQPPATFDYIDAPWASAYGLSKETAYLEAMENTGYQRSVSDMKRAGLNPAVIFGSGGGYSAGAPAFVSSVSGSGSGSGRRRSSGGKSFGKLFSGSAYSVMSALGGIVGAAATKSAGGYWLGTSLAQGAMSALSLLTGHKG